MGSRHKNRGTLALIFAPCGEGNNDCDLPGQCPITSADRSLTLNGPPCQQDRVPALRGEAGGGRYRRYQVEALMDQKTRIHQLTMEVARLLPFEAEAKRLSGLIDTPRAQPLFPGF